MFVKSESERAHEELHKSIFGCECKPWRKGIHYCDKCQKDVIDFMNTYGAGVLCRDEEIEYFKKESSKLYKEKLSLIKRLGEKIKRVEELKKELETQSKPKTK